LGASDQSRGGAITTPGTATANTTYGGGYAHTTATYNPGSIFFYSLPGAEVIVKMYPGPKPKEAPGGVFDANEVVTYLGAKYKKKG